MRMCQQRKNRRGIGEKKIKLIGGNIMKISKIPKGLSLILIVGVMIFLLTIFMKSNTPPQEKSISSTSTMDSIRQCQEKARDYLNKGRYEEAITELKKIIKIDPNYPYAYKALSSLYAKHQKYLEAIKTSERYLEIKKNKNMFDVNDIIYHAALLEVEYGPDEAIKFLESYREIFPRTVEIDIEGLKQAKAEGTLYFPYFREDSPIFKK